MNVAETHLSEGGYLGVSLEEVAREVGVSKPALYYHFPEGKEELFVAIAHRALGHHRSGLERAVASAEDGAERLRAIARWFMFESDRGHPMGEIRDLVRFVSEQHQGELAEAFFGSLYGPIYRVISSAVESGEFRQSNLEFLAWAFLSLLSGMLEAQDVPSSSSSSDVAQDHSTAADRIVDLFLNGILA